jgi:hypothetical protein
MPEMMVCPHCKGTGMNYIIVNQDGKPTLQPVNCVVCDGKGNLPAPTPAPPPPAAPAPTPLTPSPELWPILVPFGIFALFFAFLLM